jgi:hypothetical protein
MTTLDVHRAAVRPTRLLHAAWRCATLFVALAALLAACGGDSSTGPGDDGEGPDGGTPSSEVPPDLVGSWRYGSISPSNFWNEHTGQYAGNAYGFADYITFQRRGKFTRLVYIYTNSYGCQTQVWTQMEGTVEADDETFTLYPTKGKYKVADNCVQRNNYERPMRANELREKQGDEFRWSFEEGEYDGRTYLAIRGDAGDDPTLYQPDR